MKKSYHKNAFTLAESRSDLLIRQNDKVGMVMPTYKMLVKRPAFTLAEVLITLGIIGVVAAITMPTLIQNYQKQVYVNGLKKGISTISNAFQKMVADEGVSSLGETTLFSDGVCELSTYWDGNSSINQNGCEDFYGNMSVFENILPKYLKIVKICNNEQECNITYKSTYFGCSNNKCTFSKPDRNGKITDIIDHNLAKDIKGFYTADGMIFYIRPYSGKGVEVYLDINGKKGPNTLNRDLFSFFVDGSGKISYYGEYGCAVGHLMENGWKMDY